MLYRHQPKHYVDKIKDTCRYCRQTPPRWQQVGDEKVCLHCGTRVFNPQPPAEDRWDEAPKLAETA
jgi:hypothetical protein